MDRRFSNPLLILGVLIFFGLTLFAQSYGDKGWKLDSSLLDPRFPAMEEWAKAGVEGGIPDSISTPITARITPKDDLQKAIDKVAISGGVLLCTAGEYKLTSPVYLRSGVILRGINKSSVVLKPMGHGFFWRYKGKLRQGAILFKGIENAGIENITIQYAAVNFEPNDKSSDTATWTIDVFHKRELRDTTLFVEQVWMHQSKNCWVQDCNILWSGSDPIRITLSGHITCRRNFIDRCYNKNDGGMGYYNISNSRHVLVCNEKVKRIRHLAIQNFSKYNVIIDNDLEVDVNFHDGDDGYNLVQGNRIKIPSWHSWSPLSVGVKKQHLPPGPGNLLYNNQLIGKMGELCYSNQGTCYQVNSDWTQPRVVVLVENLGFKTLYPVKYLQ